MRRPGGLVFSVGLRLVLGEGAAHGLHPSLDTFSSWFSLKKNLINFLIKLSFKVHRVLLHFKRDW